MRKYEENRFEKFEPIMEVLKAMPEAKPKDKNSERWTWFKDLPEYTEILKASSWKYAKFLDRIEKSSDSNTMDQDFGMITNDNRNDRNTFDVERFFEAVMEAVNTYTGFGSGGTTPINLAQSINTRYKTEYNHEAKIVASEKDGMSGHRESEKDPNKKSEKYSNLNKFIRSALKAHSQLAGNNLALDEITDIVKNMIAGSKSKFKYTDKEIRHEIRYVTARSFSLDQGMGSDDQNKNSLGDFIEDERVYFDDTLRDEKWGEFLNQEILGAIAQKSCGKIEGCLLCAFLSRDMLVELKTYEVTDKDLRDDNEGKLEPGCKTWCRKWDECEYAHEKCRIRYGSITDPNYHIMGNEEAYDGLCKCEDAVFNFLDNDYVRYAFKVEPRNLQDIFEGVLKDIDDEENGFRFTNTVMEKALGFNASKISRAYDRYNSKLRSELEREFKQNYI